MVIKLISVTMELLCLTCVFYITSYIKITFWKRILDLVKNIIYHGDKKWRYNSFIMNVGLMNSPHQIFKF